MSREKVEKKFPSYKETIDLYFAGGKIEGYSEESSIISKKSTGEKDMATLNNRRTVVVELIDPDKGLPVEDSLVLRTKSLVTEDTDEVTIREVLMKFPVAQQLAKHNEKRATIVNEEILNRTGNEVFLRPVKLKDLQWVVK